ncbi:flagellar motor protein MotB [Alicyclobacillus herbarius]|uniref:flagellar motor protein MotB n=1 Tax=Alicyclobacillus herbarius TaxID=122960 RepID=UPI0004011099|nr:flagellar motor protein MotB [Alicyclobacillus herbarius]
MQRPSRRSVRHRKEAGPSNERWLITYSDLITLLMIFFVIMYSMSKVDQVKLYMLEQSLTQALHKSHDVLDGSGKSSLIQAANPTDVGHHLDAPAKQPTQKQAASAQAQELDKLYQQIRQYIQSHHLQGTVSVVNTMRGVQVTFPDAALFPTGKATLTHSAQTTLKALIPFLKQVNNNIVVEGYTDNRPIHTAQFPSNWELSAARAIGVVHFLADHGIQPQRLSGTGYGPYHPVAPNTSDANRQKNRRVNIVILKHVSG